MLDRYHADWKRTGAASNRRYLRKRGHSTYRRGRYADDIGVLVKGTEHRAKALLDQLAAQTQAIGLKLEATPGDAVAQLPGRLPKIAALLEDAEDDGLA